MPNPGGRFREFVRKTTAQWVVDAEIPGVVSVYPDLPYTEVLDGAAPVGALGWASVGVHASEVSESYRVQTGPDDLGGYFGRYDVQLEIKHRWIDMDNWLSGADDHDRILDAVKTRFKGLGRQMGRPDVILQAAAWPSQDSIHSSTGEPMWASGVRDQWSRIFFTVTIYMQQQP